MGPDDLVLCSGTLPRGVPFRRAAGRRGRCRFRRHLALGPRLRRGAGRRAERPRPPVHARRPRPGRGRARPGLVVAAGSGRHPHRPPSRPEEVFAFGEDELFRDGRRRGRPVAQRRRRLRWVAGASTRPRRPSPGCADRAPSTGCWCTSNGSRGRRSPTWPRPRDRAEGRPAPNGGLNVDAWHLRPLGDGRPDDLAARSRRTGSWPSSSTTARPKPRPTWWRPRSTTGTFPVRASSTWSASSGALAATGTTAPLGVEVFSDELQTQPPAEAARLAAEATRRVWEAAAR